MVPLFGAMCHNVTSSGNSSIFLILYYFWWGILMWRDRGQNNVALVTLLIGLFFAAINACFVPLELPLPRPGATMAILGDNIYFAGMQDASGLGTSDRVDILDTKNNEWSTMRLPIPYNQIIALAVDPFVLFIGASAADRLHHTIYIFNTRTRSTQTISLILPLPIRGITIGTNAILYGDWGLWMLDPATQTIGRLTPTPVVAATTDGTHIVFIERPDQISSNVNIYDLETRNVTSTFPSPRRFTNQVGLYFVPSQSAIAFILPSRELLLFSFTGQQLLSLQLSTLSNRFGHVMINNELFLIESGQIIVANLERSSSTRFNLPQLFFPTATNIVAHRGIIYVTSMSSALAPVLTVNTAALVHQTGVPNGILSVIARDNVYWTSDNQILKFDLLTNTTTEVEFLTSPRLFMSSEIYHVYTFHQGFSVLLYNTLTGATRMITPPSPGTVRASSDSHVIFAAGLIFNFYNIALETWTETTISDGVSFQPLFPRWNMLFFPFNDRNAILGVNMDTAERIWIDTEQHSMVTRAATDTLLFLTSFSVPSTEVVIYNHTANTFSTTHLSIPRANVKILVTPNYVLFAEGRGEGGDLSTRIDIYDRHSATWLAIDMPQHFLDDELSLVAVNQFVYLLRSQRVDRLDMTSLTFLQLSLPAIDTIRLTVVRGSKIITMNRNSYIIYETSTGEWFHSTIPTQPGLAPRVSASFVLHGEFNNRFLVAKRFTTVLDTISDSNVFRGHSHEFSTGISGPISRIAWQHENSVIEDENSLTLRLTNVTDGGRYVAEVFDLCHQRMRQEANLTVDGPPEFITKLVDTVNLCHDSTTMELVTVGRNVSKQWSINGVTQSQATGSSLIIAPYQLACGSIHQICMTTTNPAGSAETCAELRLVDYESIFNGPYPTTMHPTWFSQMTVTLQVTILEEDCTNHVWLADGIQIGQTLVNAPSSTIDVLLSTDSAGRRFTVKAQCGSATAESLPFFFESVSSFTVPVLVVSIVAPFLVAIAAVVTAVVVRRKLMAKQVKEIELQSLLTQAKSESLSRDTVSVISATTWEWVPTDEFTFCPLDSLPGKISVSTPKASKEPVKVDVWTQHELTFHAPPSSIFRTKKKYSLLSNSSTNGVQVELYSPKSPKYEIKVEPASFLLEEDKQLNVMVSVKMRMTAKCKICLVVVFEQQKNYSAVEFKIASTMSTWIDLDEIEMTGEHLGGGGFGSVNRGIYRGQDVAVKRLLSI